MKQWFSKNIQLILRVVGSVLAIGLLGYLLYSQGWSEILEAAKQVEAWRFILCAGIILISRIFIVLRWHILLHSGGVKIPFRNTLSLTFTGLFASNFLPTTIGGDLVRLAGVMQMGYDRAISLASLVADRLVGMAGMVLALPFGLVPFIRWASAGTAQAISLGALWLRFREFVKRTLKALALWLKKPWALLLALSCTMGHMMCTFLSAWIFLTGMGERIPFTLIAGLWSISYFITLLPISINGYGVQELSLTFLFTRITGISMATSLILALLMRAVYMIASLPGAMFLPGALAAMKKAEVKE
jgi:glycosyltransferase 2 family protein